MNSIPKKNSGLLVVVMVAIVLFLLFSPLILSGRRNWWQAWLYAIVQILAFIVSRVVAERRNPGIIQERSNYFNQKDTKSWDKILSPLTAFGFALIPITAGLDARFHWTQAFSLSVNVIALVLMIAAIAFSSWALIVNSFFSGVVRIQTDRGHHVISDGPYKFIRHPGYTGAGISYFLTPFLLNSLWALIPAFIIFTILVIRTSLEDRTLQNELKGYRDYARKVPYRLFPGIW